MLLLTQIYYAAVNKKYIMLLLTQIYYAAVETNILCYG